jgi:hypothetical protein
VPDGTETQSCFTCKVEWFRHDLSGDQAADWAAIEQRAGQDRSWTVTWRPILVDVFQADGANTTRTLDCAFVYFLDPGA